jgi:hypothetical protein
VPLMSCSRAPSSAGRETRLVAELSNHAHEIHVTQPTRAHHIYVSKSNRGGLELMKDVANLHGWKMQTDSAPRGSADFVRGLFLGQTDETPAFKVTQSFAEIEECDQSTHWTDETQPDHGATVPKSMLAVPSPAMSRSAHLSEPTHMVEWSNE